MGSFSRTQSPVLAMPPSAAHRPSFGMPIFPHQPSPFSRPEPSFVAPTPWSQMRTQPPVPQSAGRKRSRDEAAINLDVEEVKLETIEPVKEVENEWIYGEGMVLIKNPSSYVADAGSQSGTWLEETASALERRRNEDARAINQQERPSLRSNKSQRLDTNVVSVPTTDSQLNRLSPIRDINDATTATTTGPSSQPIVDESTLLLGIGWSRISNDEDIQAAARGWARYIENQFPVNNVQIQLESKRLESYLVEASEGYFLFDENLRQGQLVAKDLRQAFHNLSSKDASGRPIFEGPEPMTAAETPQPSPYQDIEMDMA